MDISSASVVQTLPVDLASGRSTRTPDLLPLLTAHAVRQSTSPTVRAIHERDLSASLADEPSRLSLIFASQRAKPSAFKRASGSFNASVAALLAVGNNGEEPVHSRG